MKKVLFATTALVATAGVAAADVSLSGAANFGLINNGTDAARTQMYQNMSITAAMSGATDNGLNFGASMTVRTGDDADLDVGDLGTNDSDNDGDIDALSNFSFGNIFVSGGFGTLTFDRNGIDNLMDDNFSHDVSYEYSVGDLEIGVTADIDDRDTNGGAANGGEDYSISVVYNAAPAKVTVLADDSGDYDFTVDYAVNDAIGLRLNYDTDGQGAGLSETIVRVSLKQGDLSGHVAFADDDDDSWEFGLGYKAGALSLGAVIAEDGAGTDTETDLTASYDLGGGMSIRAAANETGAYFVGAALKF